MSSHPRPSGACSTSVLRRVATAGIAVATAVVLPSLSNSAAAAPARPDPSTTPSAAALGYARGLGISTDAASRLLADQEAAHAQLADAPAGLRHELAGRWFDPGTHRLTVAVASDAAAAQARAAGIAVRTVARGPQQLLAARAQVARLATGGVPGLTGYGIADRDNVVQVTVNQREATAATRSFEASLAGLGAAVRVVHTSSSPHQQSGTVSSGTVQPGNPWWPGSESNCSVGFPTTDASGGKHFLSAGHCTNDANQPAYGASGQTNRLGTSNSGGTHSINAREGDMGLIDVTESGWTLSPTVNTWGGPSVVVDGSVEAIVGDAVCHSGNTSHWQCGKVTAVNQTVDYGSVQIDGLTYTDACSLGGDSGGAWLVGSKATGLHSGGPSKCVSNPSPGEQSIFQPVNEALKKWNQTLVTKGGGGNDTTAPTAPKSPKVTGQTATSVSLSWTASTDDVGVTGYDVYAGGKVVGSSKTTTATVTGLTADTAYSFTVKAKDAAGNVSAASPAVSARTSPGGGGGRTVSNNTAYPVTSFKPAVSSITSTVTGSAAATVKVTVRLTHPCSEQIQIGLTGPSGRSYSVDPWDGGFDCSPTASTRTYAVPVSEKAAGRWTLEVDDYGWNTQGTLKGWSITL